MRRRQARFENVTGPKSALESARQLLSQLSNQPTSNGANESPIWRSLRPTLGIEDVRGRYGLDLSAIQRTHVLATTSPRALLPTNAKNPSVLLRWWCEGQQTIHEAEWVRCNLLTNFAIAEYAIQSNTIFHPDEFRSALIQFRDALWAAWRMSDQEHLLGSYLLVKCKEAVDQGSDACHRLRGVLEELDVQLKAVVLASESATRLFAASKEQTDGTAAQKPPQKAVHELVISAGQNCFILETDGRERFILDPSETHLFTHFAHQIAIGTSGEIVPWSDLNRAAGYDDPDFATKQQPGVAKRVSMLNQRLKRWCEPPDGNPWIGVRKSEGRYLNRSVRWMPNLGSEVMRSFKRKSQSVSGVNVSPHQLAQVTASDNNSAVR